MNLAIAILAGVGACFLLSLTGGAVWAAVRTWQRKRSPEPPAPGNVPTPLARQPRGAPPLPPAPGFTPGETLTLDGIYKSRIAMPPRGAYAARIIADGLRERFPGLTDTELGLVTLDLFGYARTLATGLPDHPTAALRAIVDSFGLAAEELTRLARTDEGVHFDQS